MRFGNANIDFFQHDVGLTKTHAAGNGVGDRHLNATLRHEESQIGARSGEVHIDAGGAGKISQVTAHLHQ